MAGLDVQEIATAVAPLVSRDDEEGARLVLNCPNVILTAPGHSRAGGNLMREESSSIQEIPACAGMTGRDYAGLSLFCLSLRSFLAMRRWGHA